MIQRHILPRLKAIKNPCISQAPFHVRRHHLIFNGIFIELRKPSKTSIIACRSRVVTILWKSSLENWVSDLTSTANPCSPCCPFQEGLQEPTSRIWSNDLEIYHPIIWGPPSSYTDLQMKTKTHDRLVVPIHQPIYKDTAAFYLFAIQCFIAPKESHALFQFYLIFGREYSSQLPPAQLPMRFLVSVKYLL